MSVVILSAKINVFVLVYPDHDNSSKRYNAHRYYLPKGIAKNYNAIISGKKFYDQLTDFDLKQYEEIRRLTTSQGENNTTECLLDYDYIKNHYRLMVVDLIKQKIDAYLKAVQ